MLIEKPLGTTLAESESLLRAGGERLGVEYNYRFFAGVAALWSDFQAGRFGQPVRIHMTLGHGGSPDLQGTLKLTAEQVGGLPAGPRHTPAGPVAHLCVRWSAGCGRAGLARILESGH